MSCSLACVTALLTAAAQGQCFVPATGATILGPGFVKWSAANGYASTFDVDDEGLASPPIALTAIASFPMAGAVATLDRMWVSSNGEIYLTASTAGLTQPAGGAAYGVDVLGEMRGNSPGASARIVAFGDDCEGSTASGATWNISVDQTVPGQVRVTWTDLQRYDTVGDRFSFDCTLFGNGAVQFSYSANIAGDARFVGVSIGNQVGSPASPSLDLKDGADSGTQGLLYQSFTAASWDLAGYGVRIEPNGVGGYTSSVSCDSAHHTAYGTGCYAITTNTDSVHEFFLLPSLAAAALQGHAMMLTPTANGYTASWVSGGASGYLAPSGGAVNVFASATDDGSINVTPSVPLAVPGGTVATINVMSNGVITLGAAPAQLDDFTPTSAEFAASPSSAVYTWHDWNENEAGSGRIVREEVGNVLHVTWNDVESYADPDATVNRGTVQFQLNLGTGVVRVLWVAIAPIDSESTYPAGRPFLAGIGGPGSTAPASITLSSGLPVTTSPNSIQPLALSAAPPPVYTIGGPTVPITFTVNNVVDVAPPLGVGISLLIFSVAPIPGGADMGFLGMPGCNVNILTLDVILTMPGGTAPTDSIVLSIPQPLSAGLSFYSQALSLFVPGSLPNGQNAFGAILSNGLQSYFNTF